MNDLSVNVGTSFSVVIPVYNEAEVIEDVVRGFHEKVIKKIPGATLIIAEDGSTDGTKEILSRLKEEIPFVSISGKERKGYTRAFKDALRMTETDLIFFSDSDGQHDPADVFKLLKEIDANDVVSGYKSPRRDPFHRVAISKVYNILIFLLFGLKMKDIDSGFKLIRKKVIESVLDDVTRMEYCVMSEFILKAHLAGYKIKEVPITHYARESGTTAIFSPAKLPSIIIGLIKNLLEIKWNRLRNRNR
jgi:glycosyltransferase involved in cell wall biosynthesis